MAWFLNDAGLPLIAAAILAVVISGAFGWAQDVGFWRPPYRRGSGLIAMMIISIGVGLILRYLYLYFFSGPAPLLRPVRRAACPRLRTLRLRPRDLWIMGISLVALGLVSIA